MQYLLKVSIENTPLWRLVAIEGKADISHVAKLIALAFDYKKSQYCFIINNQKFSAGIDGETSSLEELKSFDSLSLHTGDVFNFVNESFGSLSHKVEVMKAEEKLYCLIPSCLVGAGLLPSEDNLTAASITAYYDKDDCPSLNLKDVTNRLREYGSIRKDLEATMSQVSAIPFNVKG
ncbi:hypothetical protein SAMN02910357_02070 [Succinivibrio dextrinosolvens]|uniref:hypothetical protein n=1 Tax=Succinivibrio dextrinosolvens TaxID=83771 RepID=UPI0008EE28C1|nr:hypothetical protein [Succinivibrio dextrinosolvens]SFS82760.1 hypothetical protein SAMN02910357_02070 [Succinivibrio dextrinosolvens]